MTWTPELDELARRTAMAHQMGGADKVKRQHDAGRLTVRERITGRRQQREVQRKQAPEDVGEGGVEDSAVHGGDGAAGRVRRKRAILAAGTGRRGLGAAAGPDLRVPIRQGP